MISSSVLDRQLAEAENELLVIDSKRAELIARIKQLRQRKALLNQPVQPALQLPNVEVSNQSNQEEKIALFRSLFKGREDVFARRFESVRTGKSGYQPVYRREWANGVFHKPNNPRIKSSSQDFVSLSNEVIRSHLLGVDPTNRSGGDFTIGIYPLCLDEKCWFLAVDFDKSTWSDDALAFLDSCDLLNIPAILERSRSGNGGHVWIFFTEPVPAVLVRKMGTFLLTDTMRRRPEMGLDSYDRLFPSQDTLPRGGFGNLIALPLQKKPRDHGNGVFVDQTLVPFPDQWAFLSAVQKIDEARIIQLVEEAEKQQGELTGIRMPIMDENESEPWKMLPSRTSKEIPILGPFPKEITLILNNQVYVPKEGLSPSFRYRLIRLAAFQNPEFYKAQAMRHSTYDKPRIISCCEDFPNHLGIPRGCLDDIVELLHSLQIGVVIKDERFEGNPVDLNFKGTLRPEQQSVAERLLQFDTGVLSASTAFGKTVVACYLIAQRKVNTLVVVHRRQLLDQWIASLGAFLNLDKKEIGQIGGGRTKPTKLVDVAMIQSLGKKGKISDFVGEYGQIIFDECHHISASSFELVARQAKAKYVLGLSATVTRKDGHQPIVFMQCGPVRYRMDDRKEAAARPFNHKVIIRQTEFSVPPVGENYSPMAIQDLYNALASNENRNALIIEDVIIAVHSGRSPVLLTERREHLAMLADKLKSRIRNVIVMVGGMGKKQRQLIEEQLGRISSNEERLILATGRYLGEGFDDARLDTLFLALPISWRGTLAQYAGRLHRLYDLKTDVLIYDYVDDQVSVLKGMFEKRRKGYKALGYEIVGVG
jgi:superfamily II DNA or RNA helicase